MSRVGLLLLGLALMGCTARQPPPASDVHPQYVVGGAYQADGVWMYPRESFQMEASGLASVLPDKTVLTANGERADGTALTGAHATLQLPAIVRVTNLETGLQIRVRVNDRGPPEGAHRLLGLSRHAAQRLGIASDGVARIRMMVDDGPSQALRDQVRGSADALVAVAPRTSVMAESLSPPPGVAQSTRGRSPLIATPLERAAPVAEAVVALEDRVDQVPAAPGQLWIRAGTFSQVAFARQVQDKLATLQAAIESAGQGRGRSFAVRAGPYASVAEADIALDQALHRGVTDARIVVE